MKPRRQNRSIGSVRGQVRCHARGANVRYRGRLAWQELGPGTGSRGSCRRHSGEISLWSRRHLGQGLKAPTQHLPAHGTGTQATPLYALLTDPQIRADFARLSPGNRSRWCSALEAEYASRSTPYRPLRSTWRMPIVPFGASNACNTPRATRYDVESNKAPFLAVKRPQHRLTSKS